MISQIFHRINQYKSNQYLINIIQQSFLVLISQLIPVISSPLITKFYDANALAELTGMMTLGSLLIVLSNLNLNFPIILEEDDHKADQLLYLALSISFLSAIIYLIIIRSFPSFFTANFKVDEILYFTPLYVFSFSAVTIFNSWLIRYKKFKSKGLVKIIESSTYILFALLLIIPLGRNSYILALSKISGVICSLTFIIIIFKKSRFSLNLNQAKKLLFKYKDFPIYHMPSSFINVLGLQILTIFIGIFYSKEELGYFGLSNMIILAPVAFISQTLSDIFLQKTVENYNKGAYKQARSVFLKTFALLLAFALPVYLVFQFFSPLLFSFIFGKNWEYSGKITATLSLVFLSKVTISPLGVLLPAIGQVKLNSFWHVLRFLIVLLVLFLFSAIWPTDLIQFLFYYSLAVTFSYMVYFIIILRALNKLVL